MIFVDASAWIAILYRRDKWHEASVRHYNALLDAGEKFLATNWTSYEALTQLKTRAGYETSAHLQRILSNESLCRFERITEDDPA